MQKNINSCVTQARKQFPGFQKLIELRQGNIFSSLTSVSNEALLWLYKKIQTATGYLYMQEKTLISSCSPINTAKPSFKGIKFEGEVC